MSAACHYQPPLTLTQPCRKMATAVFLLLMHHAKQGAAEQGVGGWCPWQATCHAEPGPGVDVMMCYPVAYRYCNCPAPASHQAYCIGKDYKDENLDMKHLLGCLSLQMKHWRGKTKLSNDSGNLACSRRTQVLMCTWSPWRQVESNSTSFRSRCQETRVRRCGRNWHREERQRSNCTLPPESTSSPSATAVNSSSDCSTAECQRRRPIWIQVTGMPLTLTGEEQHHHQYLNASQIISGMAVALAILSGLVLASQCGHRWKCISCSIRRRTEPPCTTIYTTELAEDPAASTGQPLLFMAVPYAVPDGYPPPDYMSATQADPPPTYDMVVANPESYPVKCYCFGRRGQQNTSTSRKTTL